MAKIDWRTLLRETRAYLWPSIDDKRPVPVNELEETAKAHGYSETEIQKALRGSDAIDVTNGQARLSNTQDGESGPQTGSSEDESSGATEASKYRQLYERACELAGSETWEMVEQQYIEQAFAEAGFGQLVANDKLHDHAEWQVVDYADTDADETDWRYYCRTGTEPRPAEFERFYNLLVSQAPDDYEPYLFRVEKAGKAPATTFGSWKHEKNQITLAEAKEWMEEGGNVGIAGTPDDSLANVDIDDDEQTTKGDLKETLLARSRSRAGFHGWYFNTEDDVPNIPTDTAGEVRTDWQYVVAPGSFVASAAEEIPEGAENPGYYTVEEENPVATIEFDELPEVFHEFLEREEAAEDDESEDVTREGTAETPDDYNDDPEGSTRSAVFDIDAEDLVTTNDTTARFTAVFHGSSTSANMSVSDKGHLQCWRHNVTHGGLQALAVMSDLSASGDSACRRIGKGHKRSNAGNNRLKGDWRLVWYAWHEAKSAGHIPSDDPIPYRVLVNLAVADSVVSKEDLIEREADDGGTYRGFPSAEAYNEALEHVESVYGVEPGREPAGTNDGEPVSALPLGRLDALDHEEARRYAKNHGVEWPTTRQARNQLRDAVFREMRSESKTVIEAPTALGKSHTVASEAWTTRASTTGEHPVVQFHATRDARDEAAETSSKANVTYTRLLGRSEACDVAAGLHDPPTEEDDHDRQVITLDGLPASEWFDKVCDGRGVPFSVAHQYLQETNDQAVDMPCCGGETSNCPAVAQWDGLPRNDDGVATHDVIHATHPFAYVPSLVNYTNVVFDECPDFGVDMPQDRIQRAVTAFLKEVGAPISTWEGFVSAARHDSDGSSGSDYARERSETVSRIENDTPSRDWYLTDPDAHTLAPALARSIWRALASESDVNGRYVGQSPHDPPRLDAAANDEDTWNRTWVTVVLDEDNRIQAVRHSPDLSGSRSVVGLDAHPTKHLWQRNTTPNIAQDRVLDTQEQALWRRYERGLTVVQVGDAARPLARAERMSEQKFTALASHLSDHYNGQFNSCITTAAAEPKAERLLEESGVSDPRTLHYGEEKSRNDFGDEDVGLVNGCMDPGDEYVINLLAECGLKAEPEMATADDGEETRAWGRGFVGPHDSEAAEILASVRENHVAQAAGRYARNADDPDDTAIVYVRTTALPDGFADLQVNGVEWVAGEKQRHIIKEMRDKESATTQEIAEEVEASERHVRDTLQTLAENGLVECEEGEGAWGANLYHALAGLSGSSVDMGLSQDTLQEPDANPPEESGDDEAGNMDYALPLLSTHQAGDDPPPGQVPARSSAGGAD
jgi:hypothetical protein